MLAYVRRTKIFPLSFVIFLSLGFVEASADVLVKSRGICRTVQTDFSHFSFLRLFSCGVTVTQGAVLKASVEECQALWLSVS